MCGACERCGRPGHLRHYPGVPATGIICDRCGVILLFITPATLLPLLALSAPALFLAHAGYGMVLLFYLAILAVVFMLASNSAVQNMNNRWERLRPWQQAVIGIGVVISALMLFAFIGTRLFQ